MKIWHLGLTVVAVILLCAACAISLGCAAPPEIDSPDGEFDVGVSAGKGDGNSFSECELREVLAFVNQPETSVDVLIEAGLAPRTAKSIVDHRDRADHNHHFDSIEELDDVSWVGASAFRRLVEHIAARCPPDPGPGESSAAIAEVVFSPQSFEQSHLPRVAQAIDQATRSVDIAIYSFSDSGIQSALERAVRRGVSVRMVFESAAEHRAAPQGTFSAKLEDAGVDVRWINTIMHHKFAIIDGPRQSPEEARAATLITGSGNWSSSAGTRYDENTVFLRGNPELLLRFQREFNFLWDNSRELAWNQSLEFFTSLGIDDEMIAAADDPGSDAVFTSANFEVKQSTRNGPTFSVVVGKSAVADRLVELIRQAEGSVYIASGHLRSRPVAEALVARRQERPDLDIRVYLDQQEYLSESSHRQQEEELSECLDKAGESESKRQNCLDTGFLFSYTLHQAGIPLRYKFYGYRWDFSYALQMHHKYMLIDGETLASGSYNLSDNAEHKTMENMVIYQASAFGDLLRAFEANFMAIWETGRAEGLYDQLMQQVEGGGSFPIVFAPMAIDWAEATTLKRAMREHCPAIDSAEYRSNPGAHRTCGG